MVIREPDEHSGLLTDLPQVKTNAGPDPRNSPKCASGTARLFGRRGHHGDVSMCVFFFSQDFPRAVKLYRGKIQYFQMLLKTFPAHLLHPKGAMQIASLLRCGSFWGGIVDLNDNHFSTPPLRVTSQWHESANMIVVIHGSTPSYYFMCAGSPASFEPQVCRL